MAEPSKKEKEVQIQVATQGKGYEKEVPRIRSLLTDMLTTAGLPNGIAYQFRVVTATSGHPHRGNHKWGGFKHRDSGTAIDFWIQPRGNDSARFMILSVPNGMDCEDMLEKLNASRVDQDKPKIQPTPPEPGTPEFKQNWIQGLREERLQLKLAVKDLQNERQEMEPKIRDKMRERDEAEVKLSRLQEEAARLQASISTASAEYSRVLGQLDVIEGRVRQIDTLVEEHKLGLAGILEEMIEIARQALIDIGFEDEDMYSVARQLEPSGAGATGE